MEHKILKLVEGVGPRGGEWHITSGGNKSYYQCKTPDCSGGHDGSGSDFSIWWILLILFAMIAFMFICFAISKARENEIKRNESEKIVINNKMLKAYIEEKKIPQKIINGRLKYMDLRNKRYILSKTFWDRYAYIIKEWYNENYKEKD